MFEIPEHPQQQCTFLEKNEDLPSPSLTTIHSGSVAARPANFKQSSILSMGVKWQQHGIGCIPIPQRRSENIENEGSRISTKVL